MDRDDLKQSLKVMMDVQKTLKNQEELETFKKQNEVCLVYFGKEAEDLKEIEKIAREELGLRYPQEIVFYSGEGN